MGPRSQIECREPEDFSPFLWQITRLLVPRVRSENRVGCLRGADIPPYDDSLIMLLITAGVNRDDAIRVMDRALGRNLRVEGVKTLAPLLLAIIDILPLRPESFPLIYRDPYGRTNRCFQIQLQRR
jgi:acetyl-CoA carboxylase biotin carboxylase subunit/propionyl-CoA carboxylase alpha chain